MFGPFYQLPDGELLRQEGCPLGKFPRNCGCQSGSSTCRSCAARHAERARSNKITKKQKKTLRWFQTLLRSPRSLKAGIDCLKKMLTVRVGETIFSA